MYTVFSIIIILVCILLTLVVLIQNPKGGGIAANFAAPNQIMGVKRSSDVIEKATWILAVVLIVFSLASNFVRPTVDTEGDAPESRIKDQIENTAAPAPLPVTTTTESGPRARAGSAGGLVCSSRPMARRTSPRRPISTTSPSRSVSPTSEPATSLGEASAATSKTLTRAAGRSRARALVKPLTAPAMALRAPASS